MFGYHRTAWAVSRGLVGYLLWAISLMVFTETLSHRSASIAGVFWAILLLTQVCRSILLREPMPVLRMPKGYFTGHGRALGVGLLIVLPGAAGALALLLSRNLETLFYTDPAGFEAALMGAWALSTAMQVLMLLVLGTAIPAAVLGERGVLRGAVRRAPWAAWRVFLGLLLGPLAFAAATTWGLLELGTRLDLLGVPVWSGELHWPAAGLALAETFAWLVSVTLVAAVLCGAYQAVEGGDDEPVAPPAPA